MKNGLQTVPGKLFSQIAVGVLLGTTALIASETTVFTSDSVVASPGSAYDYNKQKFIGQSCVTGDEVPRGAMDAAVHVETAMKQDDVSQMLGFGVSGRARFGVTEASLSAKFLNEAATSSYSLSTIYSAVYNFQTIKLENVKPSQTSASLDRIHWQKTCGGGFVDEVHRGARLFLSVRVDFKSDKEKQDFEESFQLSTVWGGADQTLRTASQKFSRDVKIVVSAYQLGGDTSQLTALFGNSQAAQRAYIECSLGTFESCAVFLSNALRYATNTETGFASQIAAHPADIYYGVASYDTAGIYKEPPPGLPQLVEQSRIELATLFEQNYNDYLTAKRQESVTPFQFNRLKLKQLNETLWSNLVQITGASRTCYDTPEQCPTAVHDHLQLKPVDRELLQPPTWYAVCHAALGLSPEDPFRSTVEAILFIKNGDIISPDIAHLYPYECGTALGPRPETLQSIDLSKKTLAAASAFAQRSETPQYKHLFTGSGPISDLTPLLALPGLTSINVEDQQISDLRPLSLLTELETLVLNRNKIEDIEPLKTLHHLRHLEAASNQISDLSALKSLAQLRELKVSENQIVHLDALAGLAELRSLIAENNHIDDLAPLKDANELQILNAQHNSIKSLDQCPKRLLYLNVIDNFIPDSSFEKLCGNCGAPALIEWGAPPPDPHIMSNSHCGPAIVQLPGPSQ